MFENRYEAGRRLARVLTERGYEHPVVLGIPRGGVPVASEVARALGGELGVAVARKLGAPNQPELAIGAVTPDGASFVNRTLAAAVGADAEYLEAETQRKAAEAAEREAAFDGGRRPDLRGRTVIVVDDGVATGATAIAALRSVRASGAAEVVLAVPVGAPNTLTALRDEADDVVCLVAEPDFFAVGQFYRDFEPLDDDDVLDALRSASPHSETDSTGSEAEAHPEGGPPTEKREVKVRTEDAQLDGILRLPEAAGGMVIFAHGSGSSRLSPRNNFVADELRRARLASLLFDLLTPEEEAIDDYSRERRFDISLLTDRLVGATRWAQEQPELSDLAVGYFGASTGAAAALRAAARLGDRVDAVVSRGGRPDLAGEALGRVSAPTLLIVGGHDPTVLELNRTALEHLRSVKQLAVVPGATHLFEEPGTLEEVARLACEWFRRHLKP